MVLRSFAQNREELLWAEEADLWAHLYQSIGRETKRIIVFPPPIRVICSRHEEEFLNSACVLQTIADVETS